MAQEATAPSPYLEVTLTEAGTLAEKVGERLAHVDFLVVKGPLNAEDFAAMRAAYDKEGTKGMISVDLSGATIENNVLPDGAFDFYNYDGEKDVDGPRGDEKYRLERVVLPQGLAGIGKKAFYGCSATNVNIPTSLTSIGRGAFEYAKITGEIDIPATVKVLEPRTFAYTKNISDIDLHRGLEEIGDSVFCESRMRSIGIPSSVKKIGEWAYNEVLVDYRTSHPIALSSVEECGEFAFTHTNLGLLEIKEGMKAIPSGFMFLNRSIMAVGVPASVRVIGSIAYCGAHSLEVLEFRGNSIDKIELQAFKEAALTTLTLPAEVGLIEEDAFSDIPSLKEIYVPSSTPPATTYNVYHPEKIPFGGTTRHDIPVYIPLGSKEAYEADGGWNYFTNFIEKDFGTSGVEETVVAGDGEVKVYVSGGRLRIDGAAPGTRYTAYTLDGRMVSAGTADAPASLPTGAYIVKVADRGYKVVI